MWGKSLCCDVSGCDSFLIKDVIHVQRFARALVKFLNMKAFGQPRVVNFGEGEKEGLTLVQLIETSCITAHFSNDLGKAFIDIFSCKDYDSEEVAQFCKEYFGGKSVWWQSTSRG